MTDIELTLLNHLRESGINAFERPIHSTTNNKFIIIHTGPLTLIPPSRLPILGLSQFQECLELCNLESTSDCPEGFPNDHLKFYELCDQNFIDQLISDIRSKLANGEANM